MKDTIQRLACCQYTKEEAERLADELASGKWTHDYPITVDEAQYWFESNHRHAGRDLQDHEPVSAIRAKAAIGRICTIPYPMKTPGKTAGDFKDNRTVTIISKDEGCLKRRLRLRLKTYRTTSKASLKKHQGNHQKAKWKSRLWKKLTARLGIKLTPSIEESSTQNGVPRYDWIIKNRWYLAAGICAAGLLLGFLLSYLFQVRPLQDLLSYAIDQRSTGEISSNQIKSDLSNTRLRQQEMEIRYLTATARLESANQYIILLRMKDQVSLAHLFVVEKDGLEARKALAEIRTLFDQLRPYIVEKDTVAADELDDLIQTTGRK